MSIEKGWVHGDGQKYTCPQGAARAMGRKERRDQETSHCLWGQPLWLTCGHLKLSKAKPELTLFFLFYSPFEAGIYPFPKAGLQSHLWVLMSPSLTGNIPFLIKPFPCLQPPVTASVQDSPPLVWVLATVPRDLASGLVLRFKFSHIPPMLKITQ